MSEVRRIHLNILSNQLRANYFADDEFRETVCEIVKEVPDGHWITLIIQAPEEVLAEPEV